MIKDLIKWGVPGLATVLAGTTLCLAMAAPDIEADLSSRSGMAAEAAGFDWAEISLVGRDLLLAGTTTDAAVVESAVMRLQAVPGIRSVTADVTLAPLDRPYRLVASVDSAALTLAGGIPDEAARERLLERAGLDDAALDLRSGTPDRRTWLSAAEFAVDQARYLDQGQVTLTDLTVDISGRAASERAFRDLLIVLRAGPPTGVTLGKVSLTPALVSPYVWNASFDGKRIDVSGYVPDEDQIERLRVAEVGSAQVATGLVLASGEPAGFAGLSRILVEQLARLEYGTASISDGRSTLTGAPATLEVAQAIVDTLEPSGTIVVLEPPRVADYWMSVTRQPGGLLVFDGYAPDEATREAFAARDGADTTWLKLGRGAPERYHSAAEFGLAALEMMSEGRFALRDNVMTLSGVARSGADYQALRSILAEDAPQGLVLARGEIAAPRTDDYRWSATRLPSGATVIGGHVPSPEVEAELTTAAGDSVTSSATYASGEPRNFVASALTAIDLLQWLSEGSVTFDGSSWLVTGTAASTIDKGAIDADFVTRQLAAAGWSMAVAGPAPALPIIDPYAWSADKNSDGHVTLSGYVPTDSLKRYLAVHAGDDVSDLSQLGAGAPDDFVAAAGAALDAVLSLEEGLARFDGRVWTLAGRAGSDAERDQVVAALETAVGPENWSVEITLPAMAPEIVAQTEALLQAAPSPAAPEAGSGLDYTFMATREPGGATTFTGQIPAEPALRYFAAIADADTTAVNVVDGAPAAFLPSAETGIRGLMALEEGQLEFAAGSWSLRGVASSAATRDAVMAQLDADAGGAEWTAELSVAEQAAIGPAATQPAAVSPADASACVAPLAEFSARNAILFQSGAALITAESAPALDELAAHLALCPNTAIAVEGHTDADGDENLNLALSVARAEAVIAALVERGVEVSRLYAVGFGEARPIGDNETAAGKRLNRRIVVTVNQQL